MLWSWEKCPPLKYAFDVGLNITVPTPQIKTNTHCLI